MHSDKGAQIKNIIIFLVILIISNSAYSEIRLSSYSCYSIAKVYKVYQKNGVGIYPSKTLKFNIGKLKTSEKTKGRDQYNFSHKVEGQKYKFSLNSHFNYSDKPDIPSKGDLRISYSSVYEQDLLSSDVEFFERQFPQNFGLKIEKRLEHKKKDKQITFEVRCDKI